MGKQKDSIVKQAGILAAAGIISRIIGLLYKSPLNSVIGKVGMGYYQAAYYYYTIILLISSYSIPSAISKIIAQKLSVREYRNAHRTFYCALVYVTIVGAIGSAVLYFGAGLFVSEQAVPVLRVFAPTVLIYGPLGVLRGYFQAHKSMVQTSVSQIMEQIVNAIISISAAYFMIKSFAVTGDTGSRAIMGASGSAIGTGAGVVSGLIFMLLVYGLNSKLIKGRVRRDTQHREEPYGDIFKEITFLVTPFILSTAVYNLSASVNTKVFTDIYLNAKQLDENEITGLFGLFSGQSMTISNIPIAFASAMASAMIPSIAPLIANRQRQEAKEKIALSVKSTMIISIPCAVGLFALAAPITNLLFRNTTEDLAISANLLMALSLSVIFYALSTLNNSILQGIGRVNIPVVNAAIALVTQTIVLVALLFTTDWGVYCLPIANTVYSGMLCVLNQLSVRKAIGYSQEFVRTFGSTGLASILMGLAAFGTYQGLFVLTSSMTISVIPAIIVAVPVYFVALILFKGLTEEELKAIPKGTAILRIAKKCRLMR